MSTLLVALQILDEGGNIIATSREIYEGVSSDEPMLGLDALSLTIEHTVDTQLRGKTS